MDSDLWERVKDIFIIAVSLEKEKRDKYIKDACGNNEALKQEIKSLISSFENSGEFLDNPEKDLNFSSPPENDPYLNKTIGSYKIEKVIAEGGMGRVYLGIRTDKEFSQKVAIKLIKYDDKSAYLLQRFQNERQTLANLNHPYIANLLDGGTTEDGIPYFIMEYIEGIPVTEYCDNNCLTIEDRLLLFQKICSAVNYAHKNLVVHRDIKPGNILVTGDGNPKLLDFGISKILKVDPGTDSSDYTVTKIWNLTPDYASPEQLKGEKITTATDIYSLGVVLYKLLTGRHPYDIRSFLPAEITRIVCETIPEKPSTVFRTKEKSIRDNISTSNLSPENIAGYRKNTVEKLSKILTGDLDNIIMMALRKEPERRYSSIEQFSDDIKRYLTGMPVIARNDTLSYRSSKFIRRHKFGFAALVTIILLLIAGFIGISWQAKIAASQRDKAQLSAAKVKKINSFLQQMLSSADPEKMGKNVKVIDVLRTAEKKIDNDLNEQPEIRAALRTTIGVTLENLGYYDDAIAQLKSALATRKILYGEKNTETAQSTKNLALAYQDNGEFSKAIPLYQKAIGTYKEIDSTDNPSYAEALNDFGTLYISVGKYDKAMSSLRTALAVYKKTLGNESQQVASALNNIALTSDYKGDLSTAEKYYKETIKLDTKILGKNNLELAHPINNLAFILQERGKYTEAIKYFRRSLKIREKILGINHPDCILGIYNLGCMNYYVDNFDQALTLVDSAIFLWSKIMPADYPLLGSAYYWKAKIFNSKNMPEKALSNLKKSLKIRMTKGNQNKYFIARTECELGRSYMLMGKFKPAESLLLKNLKILEGEAGDNTSQVHEVDKIMVKLYTRFNKPVEAEKYKKMLSTVASSN